MSCLYPIQQAKLILAVEELWNLKNMDIEIKEGPKMVDDAKIEHNVENLSIGSLRPLNGRKFSDLISHDDNWSQKRDQRGYSNDFNFNTLFEFLENDPLLERL